MLSACQKYSISTDNNFTVDQLRKVLQKLVKSTVEKLNQGEVNENPQKDKSEVLIDNLSKKEQTKPSNMSITSQIDQFKEGEDWSSFATQLDAFIMLNDVPDTKRVTSDTNINAFSVS